MVKSDSAAMKETPGPGHNSGTEETVIWERWQKKRTFVRALEGTYGELVHELFSQPRVYRSKDLKWKGGPQNFGKKVINPGSAKVAQSIECHIDCFAPGGYGQRHGHMNSAVFYVLKGKGHDVHDGRRLDWEAGDALIVENACVHQHSDGRSHAQIVCFGRLEQSSEAALAPSLRHRGRRRVSRPVALAAIRANRGRRDRRVQGR